MNENKKTGFNYLDKLDPQERAEFFKRRREYWNSLSIEERTKLLNRWYTAIRKKRQQNPLLRDAKAVPDIEVARIILNEDMPRAADKAVIEASEKGHVDSVLWLRDAKKKFKLD